MLKDVLLLVHPTLGVRLWNSLERGAKTMGKSTKLKRVLLLLAFLMPLPSLLPSVWGDVQEIEVRGDGVQIMQKITEEELRAIEGHYAINVPNHQGYWVAVGFTMLVGAAAFLAWTRWR